MANGNLPACLAVTLPHEGGYTNDPRDPGNWTGGAVGVGELKGTNMGIAAHSFPNLDIKNLKQADVIPIYDRKYWRPVRGDDLPFGVDLAVFDYAVNSGVGRAPKELQRVLGVDADGQIGPITLKAAIMADGKATVQKLCVRRMSFLRGLRIWETFKRGWSRRVADVEAKAVAMWLARGASLAPAARRELEIESEIAGKTAQRQNGGAGGVGSTGGGTVGIDTIANGGPNWLLVGVVVVVVGVIVVGLVVQARKNKDRAAAYAAVATGA